MTHGKVTDFSNGNYERRSSQLGDENAKSELYLKRATVIYGFYLLAVRLSEIYVGKARLLALVQL